MTEYEQRMWRICEAMIWVPNSSKAQEKAKSCKTFWTSRWFQRYQADIVELYKSLTEEEKLITF